MLNWRELEERAELAQQQVADAADEAMRQSQLEEDGFEPERWRRVIANALISIGSRIDPEAALVAPGSRAA